jgi:two-component system CheB/CheR fusion protein
MILTGGRLLLTDKDPSQSLALPIDRFFRSLAQDAGEQAIGVILSGTGSDGSRGIRDIHDAGGLVIAQSADSAKFDGMPNSAVNTGVVDFSLPPEDIPATLLRHIRHPLGQTLPHPKPAPPEGMAAIFNLLRDACGIDFTYYKPDTVARRTERRLAISHIASLDEYAKYLASNPAELNQLYKDLLIGVTEFFRDPEAFSRLEHEILPSLLGDHDPAEEVRIWVAACATGEEAYSVAMLVQEFLDSRQSKRPVKIFATDAHRASLDAAAAGVYDKQSVAGLSPERLARFFVQRGETYQVSPELRKLLVFAQHNLLKDAPFTKLDLICCRNLLIYFQPVAQKKTLSLFHFGVKTGGVLFLGPSEGTGDLADEFDPIDTRWKFFRKRRDIRLPTEIRLSTNAAPPRARLETPTGWASTAASDALLIGECLLDDCMPASLLVNERSEIVRTFGGANRFLSVQDGWFSSNMLTLLAGELRVALAGALPRAFKEMRPVAFKGLRASLPDGERMLNVRVSPFRPDRASMAYCLIRLEELDKDAPATTANPHETDLNEASRENVISLESELRYTKENLQAMIEEMETSNEELQATNEELVASNEELQSTNEELHSVNEELYTVNGEYQKKIAELTELTADMDNLLAGTEVHTIFLDNSLCIRKFTPKIAEAFTLLPQDIGRSIGSFTYTLDHPSLMDDIRRVLETSERYEQPVRDRRGNWYLLRILPYRSGVVVAGVLLTLVDIGRLKQAEEQARAKDEQLAGILRNSPSLIFIKDSEGRYLFTSLAFQRLVNCDPTGKTVFDLFPQDVAQTIADLEQRVFSEGVEVAGEVGLPHPDGMHTYLRTMFPLRDASGAVTAMGGISTDVTQIKRSEEQARESVRQRDRFLATLSHELRNPLAAICSATSVIENLGASDAETPKWFKLIERRAWHMARLLDDLLDVCRITQNKVEIRKGAFDLRSIVSDALEETQTLFELRRLRLTTQIPDEPLIALGDPARLQQVAVNLLTNAAKYTPEEGQVWLTIAAEADGATIAVRDTGVGLSPEMVERAFDLFVQADETLDRADGGIGVGLTLVRSIVELHGGRVTAESDGPGRGSQFKVWLPLELAGEQAGAIVGTNNVAPRPSRPLNILSVEDDSDIRKSLQAILELSGHQFRGASSAQEALDAVANATPDVMLIDIGIPDMNGYELGRRLRSQYSREQLMLVAVTGYGRPADREATQQAGFDAHLTKPFRVADLFSVLGNRT